MKKKLLVLAAGILQIPVIKRAHELGYYVIAADGDTNAEGLRYADKAICANITDEELMLRIALTEKIDGVIHPCSEVSMNVMGRINDVMNLSGVTYRQALVATNKHLMREAFKKYGAPSPLSILTQSPEDAWEHFKKLNTDGILKPSRNSGSRGIAKVIKGQETKDSFIKKYNIALQESRDKSVLIEQFIDGPEFSVEIIVWEGCIHVIAVTDKKTTGAPHFVELGHNQPSCFSEEIVSIIKDAAVKGVKALGVDKCACHAEVKVMDNQAYLMEIGARLGGDFISTVLTQISTGIDMIAAAIDCSLNIKPDLTPKSISKSVCIRYFCPNPGKLFSISNLGVLNNPNVYDWKIYKNIGDVIPNITSSVSRSGHVIVTNSSPQKAIDLADKIISEVIFNVE